MTEKARDIDNLTPLDARNSLLMDPPQHLNKRSSFPIPFGPRAGGYDQVPLSEQNTAYKAQPYSDQGVLLADASNFQRSISHSRSMESRDESPARIMDPVSNGYQATGYGGGGNAPWQPQRGGGGSYAY
jgi:hypothetical protein